MKVLETIRQRSAAASAAAQQTYQSITQRLAAGDDDLQPDDVEGALQSTGKSVDELADDVTREQRRQQHQTALRQRPELVAKSRELRERIADLDGERRRKLEEVEDECRALIQTVRGELVTVERSLELADRSMAELSKLVPRTDQENELVERRDEIAGKLRTCKAAEQIAIHRELQQIDQELARLELERVLR